MAVWVFGASLGGMGLLHASEFLPTSFPAEDFPFSSWQLPPVDPAQVVPAGLPPHYPIAELMKLTERRRVVEVHEDRQSVVLTSTLDENLDLAAELKFAKGRHAKASVPLGPRIVAGQGAAPENLTFVKILNAHGIADVQFLSHPPSVKGGVGVASTRTSEGAVRIAATPLSDVSVRRIPLFNDRGGRIGEFSLPPGMQAPVSIAGGDFLTDMPGGEFVVTSKLARGPAIVVSAHGKILRRLGPLVAARREGEIRLEAIPNGNGGHDLLAVSGDRWQRLFFDGKKSLEMQVALKQPVSGVFPTAFHLDRLLVGKVDPVHSIWLETEDGVNFHECDVGIFENRFWFDLGMHHGGAKADWIAPEDGQYVRNASYAHLRVEGASPRAQDPASLESNPLWSDEEMAAFGKRVFGRFDKPLIDQPYQMWEPTFTHRMSGWFKNWMDVKDPRHGVSRYGALDRDGHTDDYQEGGGSKVSSFLIATYAYGLPALDSIYNQSLRGFLNQLSPRFREHPERVFSMEPNHEHEINIGRKKSVGDYNPKMIEGFFLYLVGLHGRDLNHLNALMGTSFTTHFDAPRNLGRGPWDELVAGNPFYDAWYFYNRYVINRRIANTFRESLLAGFPPEVIKSHQIPDSYAVASTREFSNTQERITPVDYALSAGVGFGFTRYGVWYQNGDMMEGARSSGFDSIILGEYNALTADETAAVEQLKFIFEKGGIGVHCMYWPAEWHPKSPEFNRTMAAAIQDLRKQERPRPGYAGGIGRVVPYRDGERIMNIASLGTAVNHTGLIKSLREDGSWEGSVYAVPFRTAIRAEVVATSQQKLADGGTVISTDAMDGLEGGDQVEVTFLASASQPAKLTYQVSHRGVKLPGLSQSLDVHGSGKHFRLILRSPLPAGGIVIHLGHDKGVKVADLSVVRQTAEIARLHLGKKTGIRNQGGVFFDVIGK
jgi:hypothetical protein